MCIRDRYIQYTLKKKEERKRRWRKAIPVFDYSIISNNCWGGFVYQGFRQRYLSPTIGLFMMGKDYVKFCYHLMDYLNDELTFIDQKEARYYHYFKKLDKPVNYPVARLKDIEIYFMHYKDCLLYTSSIFIRSLNRWFWDWRQQKFIPNCIIGN